RMFGIIPHSTIAESKFISFERIVAFDGRFVALFEICVIAFQFDGLYFCGESNLLPNQKHLIMKHSFIAIGILVCTTISFNVSAQTTSTSTTASNNAPKHLYIDVHELQP